MGADRLSTDHLRPELLDDVRRRYLDVNGDHPMGADDDAYVREHFVAVEDDAVLRDMLDERAPLPSYLLSDGTPMVHPTHGEPARIAGGPDRVHDWFAAFWSDEPAAAEDEWRRYLTGRHAGLREVTPLRIRHLTRLVEQTRAALDVLRRRPHDPTARGLLGEAVEGVVGVIGLDAVLLPMTPYDRLRFGGPTPRERWVDGPRREFLTPVPPVLPVLTQRLVLRPFQQGDAEAFTTGWASPEWTSLLLSTPMNPAEVADMVRRRIEEDPGHRLSLVVEHDGVVVGDLMLHLQGTGLSEGEIGWTVLPEHTGRGYATEGARALLDVAFVHYGLRRVVANLDARNVRSAALCERLGMRREAHKLGDFWSKGQWTDSFEYALLADEWRAAPS